MSERKDKAIRKAIRKAAREEHRTSMYWYKRMPLRIRIGYAYKILKGVKK